MTSANSKAVFRLVLYEMMRLIRSPPLRISLFLSRSAGRLPRSCPAALGAPRFLLVPGFPFLRPPAPDIV